MMTTTPNGRNPIVQSASAEIVRATADLLMAGGRRLRKFSIGPCPANNSRWQAEIE
jgi:hypothetical protein